MGGIRIVLVGPKFEGNIGAVARSMANFDLDELYLVDPCETGDEAYNRSKHGSHILNNARTVGTLEEAIEGCFLVVGTSGIVTKGESNYVRIPITVAEFAGRIREYDEKIAILFGREDFGLFQDELALCDVLITIPASDSYSVLNLSHAATIVMYELSRCAASKPTPADRCEKEQIFSFFDDLLDAIDYPPHRKETTSVMFRRLMGRAVPTKWEYNTVLGIFGDAAKKIKKNSLDRGEHH
jgi:TrmH family RNA methyltransferase